MSKNVFIHFYLRQKLQRVSGSGGTADTSYLSSNPLSRRVYQRSRLVSLASTQSDASAQKRQRPDDDEPFTEVKRKPRRKPAMGKRTDCAISGGMNLLDIFVSHVAKHTTCDQIKTFLESESISVLDIKKISHVDAMYDSFKVSVERRHYDSLCGEKAAEMWPENICCRPFVKPRSADSKVPRKPAE